MCERERGREGGREGGREKESGSVSAAGSVAGDSRDCIGVKQAVAQPPPPLSSGP